MKKLTALLLALVLALTTLTACSTEEPEGLFYDLTGLDPAATMLRIEGRDVPVEMYLYWVLYVCDYVADSYASTFVNEDGSLKWEEEVETGVTLRDYVLEEALNTAKMYIIVEKWAEDYGITLNDEAEAAMQEELGIIAEQLGGQEAFESYLAERGITPETNERMSRVFYLYANMLDLTKEEGSPLYIEDEVLYQYDGVTEDAVLADHILLFYPEDESERDATRQSMEEILEIIRSDEDPEEAFNFVADNYSEDTGRAYYPNGYLVTADSPYVQAFKDTALSLEEYEISDVVESEYGYHIIMRKPLRDYVADLYLADLITVAMDNAEVEWTELSEGFDVEAFYADYQAHEAAVEEEAGNAAADTDT